MEAKPGRLVKAVYDFPTDDAAELPLLAGDIVQVKERKDKQWSRGVCGDREGDFPIGFTVDIKTPELTDQQELFAVISDFNAQEDGDLTLKKGELVIGNQPIDSYWWRGEKDGITGIFPITHVWKVDKSILPVTSINKKMFARAKVKMNMTAQLSEEMDLYKDEIVNVIEEVEKGWYRGECNGRHGIFPASFVTILSDSSDDNATSLSAAVNSTSLSTATNSASLSTAMNSASNNNQIYENKYGYDCINSGITPYGRALFPFQAEYKNELSLKGGEIVNLIRHVDNNWIEGEVDGKKGIFPANFINIIVDCPKSEKLSESSDSACEADTSMFPPDTYGRVISDFYPQLEGDVRLKEGDTVTLIRKIDSNWYEVETDNGDSGVCPESYIEVIGSGPPSYSEVMGPLGTNPLFEINYTSSGHTKQTQSSRPLSFASSTSDSSFSSQNSANDRSASKETCKPLNNKVSENLMGLDSPLLTPETTFNNESSNSMYCNVGGDTSQGLDAFSSSYDSSPRQFSYNSSSSSFSPKLGNDRNSSNLSIPSIVKTPARPPPPANMTLSPNTSILNSTPNSSANSGRLSISSLSSHSSLDISSDSIGESEIQNQIQMKEQILKQRIGCLNKLENEMKNTSNSSVLSEIRIQISQLNDDIQRFKKEIEMLNAKLILDTDQPTAEDSPIAVKLRDEEVARKKEIERKRREQEKKNKMKEQRECIITELLQSEKDYVSDLKLLHEIFMSNPVEAKNKGVNVMALFGNLDEVISVADQLLRRLQKVSRSNQLIGECFVDLSEEMKEIYGHYCRNHDEVNSVLDKIDLQSSAGQFINHKLEILKRQTNCFDLGAMLIKPVQRILKYPLLLDQLFKCTEDDHPDKPGLKQAICVMSDVATAINEFKRQKDLVFKYRKQTDTSLSGRISKFNFHSLAKKSSRLGMRLSATVGLKNVIVDEEFERIAKKFKGIEKYLHIFLKDLSEFTRRAEELYTCAFNLAEDIAELYQERKSQQEVDKFRIAHRTILTQYWESFKRSMDYIIHSPIKQLLQAYTGPKNLIAKREDKLLDFLSSTSKMEKNKDATKVKMLQETQLMDKNTYEALNSQLLNELPKLCDLSVDIFCDCIRGFLKAKKQFTGQTARHMIELMDLPLLLGSQGSDILETFQVKHTLVMDDLSHLSIAHRQFQSCIKSTDTLKKNPSPKGSRLSFGSVASAVKFQTSSQKTKIKSTYPQSELYSACENFDAVDIMDISLKKGDVVGVIKQQDPMGNKMRWFVDSGESRGFVPAKCLIKFLPDASSPSSAWNTSPSNTWKVSTTHTNTSATPSLNLAAATPSSNIAAAIPSSNIAAATPISNIAAATPSSNIAAAIPSNASNLQNLYAKPKVEAQTKQNGIIQPARPAPPVTTSLRMVAPSRYPPVSQSATSRPKENNSFSNLPRIVDPSMNTNSRGRFSNNIPANINANHNSLAMEPVHRYEEIPESHNSEIRLLSDSSATSANSTSNILDEFDPYSSDKVPEVYDNVPDNLNSVYSSHRYEDIPESSFYEEVPSEAKANREEEYYYGLYDFDPNGPNQLSLRKGQVVLVLHKCDLNQNSEWWFVEDRHGNKGYVPALYLKKYSKEIA